ncbi:MAG TPA: ABC transporter ATP-binding protein [Bacteroidales bacterium]|nr:ABC transporter ATP-binding protein [Bacteroidales bacterium]
MENIITISNLSKYYENHKALDNISLEIKQGNIFGLLGPNGAGKTTLIRLLNQIIYPDSGTITFKGKPIASDDVLRFGYLPEERGLYKKMKVGEQAIYLAQLKGLSRNDAIKNLKFWFDKFDIGKWWNRKVEELSKGMQQKIQFIVTILHNPELLIFDEPFSGFDPINTNLLKEEILNLNKKGTTIIFSTHNMESVEEICQDIVLISKSRNILHGTVYEVKSKYKTNLFVVNFEGKLPQNIIKEKGNDLWQVISCEFHNNQTEVKLQPQKEIASNNYLLKQLLPLGNVTGFREILPSMNDVFINAVKNNKQDTYE